MRLLISGEVEIPFDFDYSIEAKRAIEAALDCEGFDYEAQVSLTLTGESEIRELNNSYREIDEATDVLSFPMLQSQPGEWTKTELTECADPDTGEVMLGDIVLCVPRVIAQASEYGHSVLREYAFLIVHSVLHLLGYDHMYETERAEMEEHQDKIMQTIGILR